MNRLEKEFARGFGMALAECQRAHDMPSVYAHVMRASGYRMADFHAAELDLYDLLPLSVIAREAWPVAGVRRRRRHSKDGVIRCEICSPLRCSKAS